MSTVYLPEVALTDVLTHPKNPRHRATADDELVESVRATGLLQPLVVAPHPDKPGKYVLVAGHRRRDALKKTKAKTAPAMLRTVSPAVAGAGIAPVSTRRRFFLALSTASASGVKPGAMMTSEKIFAISSATAPSNWTSR